MKENFGVAVCVNSSRLQLSYVSIKGKKMKLLNVIYRAIT